MGAVDLFLKISKIDGETTDEKHKGEMDIESFSWGEAQTGSAGVGGGLGAGKVSKQDFHFVKRVDKGSPNLFLGCAMGTHYPEAVLTVRKAGGGQQEYFKITMSDVLVSSYQTSGSTASELPMDQVSMNFAKMKMEYKIQDAKGNLAAGPIQTYDFAKNVKV